jgi:hypothetical protein
MKKLKKNLKNLDLLNLQINTYILKVAVLIIRITRDPREIVSSPYVLDKLISDNQFNKHLYKLQHNRFWSDYLKSTNLESNNILDF